MKSRIGNEIITGNGSFEFNRVLSSWEPFGFSAVVLVIDHGQTALKRGYGFNRWLEEIPNTLDTVVPIASVSKQFTAAAILKLDTEGRLSISDPISKYCKGFQWEGDAPTIHHLLTHTSGVIRSDTRFASSNSQEYVDKLGQTPRESPPGQRHRYSNGGYSMLAAIIESVSGVTFQSYVRNHLFLPAGMQQTRFIDEVDFDDLTVALGHHISEDHIRLAMGSGSCSEQAIISPRDAPKPCLPVSRDWSIISSGGVVTVLSDIEAWNGNWTQTKFLRRRQSRNSGHLTLRFPAKTPAKRIPGP